MSQHREIKVPPLGESVTEATVSRWLKNEGDLVQEDELLVELETDKVTLEVTAPAAGVLLEVMKPTGTNVEAGQILGKIDTSALAIEAEEIVEEALEEEAEQERQEEIKAEELEEAAEAAISEFLAPSARKMIEENQLKPEEIPGTGKDGRVTKADVMNFMQKPQRQEQAPEKPQVSEERPVSPPIREMRAPSEAIHPEPAQPVMRKVSGRREERIKMTRLRQRIAERLKHAQNTAAILTTFNEIDMSAVFEIRKRYKESFEKKYGVRLGLMSFFVKAAVNALKEIPVVNSEIDGDEIVYKNYYDIGVAVSAPQGLVVPVIRDADSKSFADLEKEISEFGQKARDGKLTIEEMTGGTFTISNGGVFGSLMATPILNPPQTAILGMHKVEDRPVAINGKVEIRPMMYVALSYDHRLIDGRESVTFLVRIKEFLESPERLLLDI